MIPLQEYLTTVYRPDCDYVDGEVQERNVGLWDHSRCMMQLIMYLGNREKEWGIEVYPSLRIQTGPTRIRVPDVCVTLGEPDGQILRKPPFLCIEVLSPEDSMSRVRERLQDFLNMGVPQVWVLDPQAKAAYTITPAEGWREVKAGVLRTANPSFEMPLSEIFRLIRLSNAHLY